jgi:hypothetical protein
MQTKRNRINPEEARRPVPSHNTFVTLDHVRNARSALAAQGHLLIEDAYSGQACDEIIEWMDSDAAGVGAERNYGDSELRIWDSQKKNKALAQFFDESNVFMSCLLNADIEAYTLLAIRNRAIARTQTQHQLGRWHIDSFRTQYKIFLFLVDVDESTGPFELVPGTHAASFKRRMAATGAYFRPSDFFTGKRAYAQLPDARVERLLDAGYRPHANVCKAGTVVIADTSAIHRARPCFEGARYALTTYFK